MKKTSIFFLILSVLLIIGGIAMKNKAIEKAEEEDLELFRQTLTEEGDFVETVDFPTEDTNKINVNLKNTDINIIGNAERSYVEVVNFNTLEYSTYLNNRSFNIETDLISAIAGRAEGGNISFDGVRDFVRFDKHNTTKKVNIYLAKDSAVKIFDIKINDGNVYVDGISVVSDFTIVLNEGDITFKNTNKLSLVKTVSEKGDVKLNEMYIANSDINTKNGNVEFITYSDWVYDYNVKSETGEIKYNSDNHKGTFSVENEEINGDFNAHVGVGNVIIKTLEPLPVVPEETAADTTATPAEETTNESNNE